MDTLSRDDIRNITSCPRCGAAEGKPCEHEGKGSLKRQRMGVNHHERMQEAQAIAKATGVLGVTVVV